MSALRCAGHRLSLGAQTQNYPWAGGASRSFPQLLAAPVDTKAPATGTCHGTEPGRAVCTLVRSYSSREKCSSLWCPFGYTVEYSHHTTYPLTNNSFERVAFSCVPYVEFPLSAPALAKRFCSAQRITFPTKQLLPRTVRKDAKSRNTSW
jgi:hypothetical protein